MQTRDSRSSSDRDTDPCAYPRADGSLSLGESLSTLTTLMSQISQYRQLVLIHSPGVRRHCREHKQASAMHQGIQLGIYMLRLGIYRLRLDTHMLRLAIYMLLLGIYKPWLGTVIRSSQRRPSPFMKPHRPKPTLEYLASEASHITNLMSETWRVSRGKHGIALDGEDW